jgi:hypothetical protein
MCPSRCLYFSTLLIDFEQTSIRRSDHKEPRSGSACKTKPSIPFVFTALFLNVAKVYLVHIQE